MSGVAELLSDRPCDYFPAFHASERHTLHIMDEEI